MQESFIKEIKISEVETLLNDYYVEVDSPDGWVPVVDFVHKGMYKEHILKTADGKEIRCNANHKFETDKGWVKAKDCINTSHLYLGEGDKYVEGVVEETTNMIPIVDITVDHPNHRYYSNGISSHNSGSGKSALKSALCADFLKDGINCLYITLELSEEAVGERIDANLLNIPIQEVKKLDKERFVGKFETLKQKGYGKLVIKEYPTSTASVTSFNLLMDELKAKQGFVPQVVFVDYLQITACARHKMIQGANSYTIQKYIAEELRAFAVQHNVLVITSVQTNRSGFNVTDMDETAIADSAGIIHTVDALFAIIRDEQLKEENKAIIKQLKNRWGATTYYNKFAIGFDTSRMMIYNIEGASETTDVPEPPKKVKANTEDWDFN